MIPYFDTFLCSTSWTPKTFFLGAEYNTKCFNEKIIEDCQKENKLISEYGKLKASAKIEFDGNIYNLASIRPLALSNDRETRKRANEAINKFYSDNEAEFDRIFDELVHVRNTIAKKMGYKESNGSTVAGIIPTIKTASSSKAMHKYLRFIFDRFSKYTAIIIAPT